MALVAPTPIYRVTSGTAAIVQMAPTLNVYGGDALAIGGSILR
jgi:hypothetical protein